MFDPEDTRPLLVIPDVHQEVDFLRASRQWAADPGGGLAGIVLLGDILDGRQTRTLTYDAARETLDQVLEWMEGPVPVLWLWGNHDWLYRRYAAVSGATPAGAFAEADEWDCDAVTRAALQDVGGLPMDRMTLALFYRGWLFSHAGVAVRFWDFGQDAGANVARLNANFADLGTAPPSAPEWALADAGPARGGFAEVGGPLWLDWLAEFEDALPVPQVVGHSSGHHPKRKGRSHCIDCVQTVCATVDAAGQLMTHRIRA